MTDQNNVDILYKPEWDDSAAQRVIAGFDALKAKAKEASDIGASVVRSSDFTLGEGIVSRVEDATQRFDEFKQQVKDTAQEFERLGDRALKGIAKISQAIIGVGVGSAFAFERRFGATDPQAVEQRRATKQFEAAFEDLGRVASRFLTPALENLAGVVEVVAIGLDKLFASDDPGIRKFTHFFDESVPEAAQAFNDLISTVRAFATLVEREVGNALDTFVTDIRIVGINIAEGFAQVISGLLRTLADVAKQFNRTDLADDLLSQQDERLFSVPGTRFKSGFEQERFNQTDELSARIKERNDKAAATADEIIETNNLISLGLEATGAVFQSVKDELKQGRIGLAEVEAWRTRKQALADEEKAYDEAVTQAKAQNNSALVKLDKDRNDAFERLSNDQRKAEAELTDDYNRERLKAVEDFEERETEIQAEQELKREQNKLKHELTLTELAARGDVAGFIEEQKRYRLSLQEQQKTDNLERDQRLAAFEEQNEDRDAQYSLELDQLHQSGLEKEAELRKQYDEQEAELYAALQDQLDALYNKHVMEQQEIEQAFLEQIAMLDSNLAGLNDLRNSYYQQDLADLDAYLAAHGAGMRSMYAGMEGGSISGSSVGAFAAGSIGGFESSIGGAALGTSGTNVTFQQGAIQNTVGDIVTKSAMERETSKIVTSISRGLRRSPTATEY